jgi:ribosomal protein S18 acetylase RimI-like enzyme
MTELIRKAKETDYQAICELFEELDLYHSNNLPEIFQPYMGPSRPLDYYLGMINAEDTTLIVAEVDGMLAGFVHGLVRVSTDIPIMVPRIYAIVDNISVRPDFRKHRFGTRLMQTFQEWAIEKCATSIELTAYEFNQPAIAFYKKLGYDTLRRDLRKVL